MPRADEMTNRLVTTGGLKETGTSNIQKMSMEIRDKIRRKEKKTKRNATRKYHQSHPKGRDSWSRLQAEVHDPGIVKRDEKRG